MDRTLKSITSAIAIEAERASAPRLTLSLARTKGDVEDAQRLRYKVFAEEMRAGIGRPGPTAGHDLTLDDGAWVAQQVGRWIADRSG